MHVIVLGVYSVDLTPTPLDHIFINTTILPLHVHLFHFMSINMAQVSRSLRRSPRLKRQRDEINDPGELESKRQCITQNVGPVESWWPADPASVRTFPNLLARKKSTASLHRKFKQSTESLCKVQDQEVKATPYQHPLYEDMLFDHGVYMDKHACGPDVVNKVRYLQEKPQPPPLHTLFAATCFDNVCEGLRLRNESRLLRDLTPLLVPSPETLRFQGVTKYRIITESVNESWGNSIPLTRPRPQPDQAIGLHRSAFTDEQLQKLSPYIGGLRECSFFLATHYMFFPFLTTEVKSGTTVLDVADRQNAHSMALAVRAVVELFRLVGRENEINKKVLAFSVSHSNESVRIYGHYAIIGDAGKQTYHRHPIRKFNFTELDGRERWTCYAFVRNVYDHWLPKHHKMICTAIDNLVASTSSHSTSTLDRIEVQSQDNLSSGLNDYDAEMTTPITSFTRSSKIPTGKKPRRGNAT